MMCGPGCGIAWESVILMSALLNMTNGIAGVWSVGVECNVMAGTDLSCWIAQSMSNVTWARWSNLRSCPTSKVMSWHFSRKTPFLSQYASRRTSLDQMQSIHCPGQQTHRPVPHWASVRDLIDWQGGSRDPPPQTVVQICLVIQWSWNDIMQATITHLIPFMPWRCTVVPEALGLS